MGILERLQSLGSSLTSLNGGTPDNTVPVDDKGKRFFEGSALDTDGVTPEKYSNIAPENQGGRV